MRLIIDANVLVAELLRRRGRELLRDSRLELYIPEKIREETEYEFRQRVRYIVSQGRLSEEAAAEQVEIAFIIINTRIELVSRNSYRSFETEARKRIPKDLNDWETVALALALPAAIWTEDYDFFGCGCATWTTETLKLQLS